MAGRDRVGPKALLSVDQAAILLGVSRSSLYRSIERDDLPLPVFKINGRLRIARAAVERLIAGEPPPVGGKGAAKSGEAVEHGEQTFGGPGSQACARHNGDGRPPCPRSGKPRDSQPRSSPTCSAARRSSSDSPSV